MSTKLLLTTFLITIYQFTNAQCFWSKSIGGTTQDDGYAICADLLGNVYTTGRFAGTVDFDPGVGTANLSSNGGSIDFFITKFDAAGNFVWAKAVGGTAGDESLAITTDNSNNVYVTGFFGLTVDFDPGPGTNNITSPTYDFFILKLNSAGNFVWAKTPSSSTAIEYSNAIAIDNVGNIFITGQFQGTVDFDPGAGTFNLTSSGDNDAFILKLNDTGNFLWAVKSVAGPSVNGDFGKSITTDAAGNVYSAGYFSDVADFDPGIGTFNLTSLDYHDAYVSKLNGAGDFVWAKSFASIGSGDFAYVNSISLDGLGDVYLSGSYNGAADFDPGVGTHILNSAGSSDAFMVKLLNDGSFSWAQSLGSTGNDYGYGIVVAPGGLVFAAGCFSETVDFNSGTGTSNFTSAGGTDIYMLKLDNLGNYVEGKQLGGTGTDFAYDASTDVAGNFYVTGSYFGTADFNPHAGVLNLTSNGIADAFVLKLESPFGVNANATSAFICAGESVTLNGSGAVSYTWDNGVTNGLSFSPTATNTYTVTGTNGAGCTENAFIEIIVNPLPTVVANASTLNLCTGDAVTLTGTGAASYVWDNGAVDAVSFIPSSTNTYTVVGTDAFGCENSDAVTVNVNSYPDVTVTASVITLDANQSGAIYQWVDCDNANLPVSGQTAQQFIAPANGNYAVVVNLLGCIDTSNCEPITQVGIESNTNDDVFLIYPNPTLNFITLTSEMSFEKISIYDLQGNLVFTNYSEKSNMHKIDISQLTSGIYVIEINTETSVVKRPFTKL